MLILYGLLIAAAAAGVTYLLLRPKLKQTQQIDLAIISENTKNQTKCLNYQNELKYWLVFAYLYSLLKEFVLILPEAYY